MLLGGLPFTGANAQVHAAELIVITATRSSEGVSTAKLASAATVITSSELEARETRDVADALRDVPGVAVSQSGAFGGLTQVRIRGAEANHVLMLIDGIKASDPYQGEFDFAALAVDEAARIEVLRGQQSALYGSDAIGGVINYITSSGRDAPGVRLRAEAGTLGTFNGAARIAGAGESADYALSGTLRHSDGYPTAPGGSRDVGADLFALSGKANWSPAANLRLRAVLRYGHGEADYNDQAPSSNAPMVQGRQVITLVDTPGAFSRSESWQGLLRAELESLGGAMTTALEAQLSDSGRDAFASYGYAYGDRGRRYQGSLVNTLNLESSGTGHALTFALDAEREQFRNADPLAPDRSRKTLDTLGFVGQYRLTVGDRFAFAAAARYDDNSYFEDAATWHVEVSYRLLPQTRLRAAAGSGVKAPGAFELFGYATGQYIGNPDLKPEKSTGWEVGVDQSVAGGKVRFGATWFESRLTSEIYTAYLPPDFSGTSLNSEGVTRQRGFELSGQARLGAWQASASYTWLDAPQLRNVLLDPMDPASFATGPVEAQAVRRPRHSASANLSYAPEGAFSGNLTLRYNGWMNDLVFTSDFSPMIARLDSFFIVNLALRYRINDKLELFARGDNLFDRSYQEVFTYEAPGRVVVAGLRARF